MKILKRIGTYSLIFLLFITVWQLTSMVTFAIPSEAVAFFSRHIDSIAGTWFYLSVVVLQVGFGLIMLGGYLFRQYKKRNSIQSQQIETKNDLLSSPS